MKFRYSKLAVCAPSSPFSKPDFFRGVKTLKEIGVEANFAMDIFLKNGRLAGPDNARAKALLHSIKEYDIIIAARGGGGCGRLFPLVKKELKALKSFSKILVGSSDITFLYLFTRALSPQIFVYGPMVCRYGSKEFRGFEKKTITGLLKRTLEFPLQYPGGPHTLIKDGVPVQGTLDGGNLCILSSSMGTPYEWRPGGSVLYLEDVNEPIYRIDRMLTQLSHAGKFRNVKAVLVGKMNITGKRNFQVELKKCLLDHFARIKGPVLTQIPTGHGKTQWPFFLGGIYKVGDSISCIKAAGL